MNLFSPLQKIVKPSFARRVDLPLTQDASARFIPWIMGIMLYFSLLLGVSTTLFFQENRSQAMGNIPHLTLEIPAPKKERHNLEKTLQETLILFPEILKWRMIPLEEIRHTFRNFFHEEMASLDLDTEPLFVDLWVKKGFAPKIATEINQKLSSIAPNMEFFLHQQWTRPLFNKIDLLYWGGLLGIILLFSGLLAVVAFSVRTGISIHSPILKILDLIGASESYIIHQFQRQNRVIFFKSLAIMALFFSLTLLGVQTFFDFFLTKNLADAHNFFWLAGEIIGAILLCGLFISFITRQVVKSALKRIVFLDA
jgi:cell division transport system permease protein